MKNAMGLIAAALLAGGLAAPADAAVEVVGTETDTLGATVITWDASFQDTTYSVGDPVLLTISWTVEEGSAAYDTVEARRNLYTPRSRHSPVEGSDPIVGAASADSAGGSVDVELIFDQLHSGRDSELGIGNAHLTLRLFVDEDGDGELEEKSAKFGVNLHVEDAAAGTLEPVLMRLTDEEGVERPITWGMIKSMN